MGTIREIYNKKCQLLLGRQLLGPAHERDPDIPEQLSEYLVQVSREIYCGGTPVEFTSRDNRIGDDVYIDPMGRVTDEHGSVLFACFNDYILSNLQSTLLFLDSFVSK
jgi:hypothetical protein